jgi:hypothetical protein
MSLSKLLFFRGLAMITEAMKISYNEGDGVKVNHGTYGLVTGTIVGLACTDIIDIFVVKTDVDIKGYPYSCITACYTEISKI